MPDIFTEWLEEIKSEPEEEKFDPFDVWLTEIKTEEKPIADKAAYGDWLSDVKFEKEEIIRPPEPTWWEKGWGAVTTGLSKADEILEEANQLVRSGISKWHKWAYPGDVRGLISREDIVAAVRILPGNEDLPPWPEMTTAEKIRTAAQAFAITEAIPLVVYQAANVVVAFRDWVRFKYALEQPATVEEALKRKGLAVEKIKGYTLGGKAYTEDRVVHIPAARGAPSLERIGQEFKQRIFTQKMWEAPTLRHELQNYVQKAINSVSLERATDIAKIDAATRIVDKTLELLKAVEVSSEFAETTWDSAVKLIPMVIEQLRTQGKATLYKETAPMAEEEKIVEEQMGQPIPDWAKKEMEELAIEREAKEEYVREMLSMSEGETLLSRIKRRGGIKWTPSMRDFGNYNEIPLSAKNRKGLPFDEMADELGMSDNQLWESLIAYKSRQQIMDEKVSEVLKRTVPPTVEKEVAKIPAVGVPLEIKRTEIIKNISSKLGVPIRLGHFRERALGIYKKKPKVIRLKAPIDVPTAAHEVGHYLNDKVFKFDLHGHTEELLKLDPKGKSIEEGYAEFVSRYVASREKAETDTPKFFTHFEKTISSVPEVKEILDTASADYERWLSMPAAAKVASHINYEPEKTGGFGFGKLYTMLIDELYPLKKYTDVARQKGLEVKKRDDPFILATLHRGWQGKADSFLRHKTFDVNSKWSGEPLTAILQPVVNKNALKDFDTYLVAKQAIFRLERDKKVGIDYKDATGALKQLEEKHPDFKNLSQRLYDYQDRLLQYARDAGLIGQETYDKFKVNLSYVPLHRVVERLGARGALGKGYANLPSVYKRFKGSEREIIPPTESIVKNTYVIIDAIERNRIAQAVARLSKLHPELGRVVEKVPPEIARVAELSKQEIVSIVKQQGFELAPKDIEDLVNVFRPSMFLPRGNIIKVVEDGKPRYYEVDPDIYRSLTMMDREQMNIMIRLLAYPARMLRIGAVSLSPEFLVRNPARDAFTAFVYSKAGFIPGLDTMRGLFSTITRDEAYWKWKISGAEHSMLTSLDREYLQQDVKLLMKDRIAKLKDVVTHPIKSAQILAELGETATRLGEFKLTMEGGKRWWMLAERIPEAEPEREKILRAGYAARDVTLDFARLGTKTRAVNQIIAFWNANIQDLDKIRRSFQDNPIRTLWKIILGITIPSVALWIANKDDERVQELPQWQRDLFWIVPTKKRLWRIPKPFTLGIIFGSGAERILDYIDEQDPESIKELGRNILRGINPGVLPTAFLAPIEAATNYSFFLERPVVSGALKRKLPELQYSPYTTETAKMIGDVLNLSPQKVEYFLRGYTGGFGKLAMETSDAIMRAILDTEEPKRPRTLADVPLIRGFIAREPWGSSESIARFYEIYERAEMGTAAINQMIDERRREKVLEYRDKYPEYKYVEILRKVAKELSELRKKRNKVLESDIDAERKLQMIEDIEKRMTRIARKAVEQVRERQWRGR